VITPVKRASEPSDTPYRIRPTLGVASDPPAACEGSVVVRGALVEASLKPRNERRKVGVQLPSLPERVEQPPIIDGPLTQPTGGLAVNVPADELSEQLAHRHGSGGLLERLPGRIVDVNARHVIAPLNHRPAADRGRLGSSGGRS
jgi:hypothetical protein